MSAENSERMTQAVYGRVSDDRLVAASAALSDAVRQSEDNIPEYKKTRPE